MTAEISLSAADQLRRIADLLDGHDVRLDQVTLFANRLPVAAQHRLAEDVRASIPSRARPIPTRPDLAVLVAADEFLRSGISSSAVDGALTVYLSPVAAFAEPARDHGAAS